MADRVVVAGCAMVMAFWFGFEVGLRKVPECAEKSGYRLETTIEYPSRTVCVYRGIRGTVVKMEKRA